MDQKSMPLESFPVFKTVFPNPQSANSRKTSWWLPTATKGFPAMSKCSMGSSNTNPIATTKEPPAPAQNPLLTSHPPQKQEADGFLHTRIKKMQSPPLKFGRTAHTLHKKWKDFQFIQVDQDRAQQASRAPAPLLAALFKCHFRDNPSPVFLAAAQLQTVLFWCHLLHPLWMCKLHQSYWEGARKGFASSGLYAFKTWKMQILHTATCP